jgi:chloride channel 7
MASLNVFLIIYFALVTITAGLSVSAGLFVPMLIIGATFGRIVGRMVAAVFSGLNPPIDTSIYALVGSAAMMAGFSRTTISLCVILVELTENTQFLLPIMLAVTCAKWVGDAFSKSIYDELMELKSIPYLENHPPHYTYLTGIEDVMAHPVVCINEVENLKKIVEILQTTSHNGFPVVKKVSEDRKQVYCGIVLRKQLLVLLETHKYHERTSRITPEVLDYHVYIQLMNHTWDLNKIDLPSAHSMSDYVLDVRPYMDRSQVVVSNKFSFVDAYRLFVSQGLRHLPIVNEDYNVVGIVTRKDLLSLEHEH